MQAPWVVAEHHAEAVVEGHRDADPVLLGVAAALANEEAVVEDVVVGQGGALGEAGGPAGVLDVDRVVKGQAGPPYGQRPAPLCGQRAGLPGGQRAGLAGGGRVRRGEFLPLRRPQVDDPLQPLQPAPDLLRHRPVVAGLERFRAHQQPDARLAQDVAELAAAVGRVDVHQHDSRLRGRVLEQHPLGAVRRPDAHPVARLDARRDQPPGEGIGVGVEPGVGPPAPGGHVHHRLPVRVAGGDAAQVGADGLAQQRHPGRAVAVGRH